MGLGPTDIEGKYEIVAKLNEGGMGAIYKVRHRLLDEIRVVKVLRPQHEDDEELRARFAREARSAIQLRHPNVVQIFDFSLDESGAGLIVMEHIDGADFDSLVQAKRRPSLPLALEIGRQSLRALGFLHRHGFVHRDVSPDNLMLTRDVEGKPLVKLIDLGIAKHHQAEQTLTVSGSFLGKFRYASPEHFGAKGPDGTEARSDLYTFGLVFYELLTSAYPMAGDSTSQLIAAHLFNAPIGFEESDPDGHVPQPVRDMVMRALEKKAEDRWADASEWIKEIETLQKEHPIGPAEADEAAELATLGHEGKTVDAMATQGKLDRAFRSETTASPPMQTSSAPFDVLLAGAEALFELGKSDQALQQVRTILSMDPNHEAARELLFRFEDPESQVIPIGEPPPIPEVAKARDLPELPEGALDKVRSLIDAGQLVRADRELGELRQNHGALPTLLELRRRLDEIFQSQLTNKIRGLLEEADDLVDDGDYPEALMRLRDAQALAPTEGPVREELTHGVEALRKKIERRERRLAIEQIEQHILQLVRQSRLEEARSELRRSEDIHGDDEVFESLAQILERAIQERQSGLVGEAGVALRSGDYEQAVRRLEEVQRLDPSNGWVQDQLDHARRHLAKQAEARRLDEERRAELDAVESALRHNDLDAATELLAAAAERWRGDLRLPALHSELQQKRARGLLEEAESAQEGRDFFKARLLIAEAMDLSPEDTAIARFAELLDETAEHEVEGSPVPLNEQSGVLHVVAEIERLRVEGEPLQAWKAVQQAINHFGESEMLLGLRQELAEQILEETGS